MDGIGYSMFNVQQNSTPDHDGQPYWSVGEIAGKRVDAIVPWDTPKMGVEVGKVMAYFKLFTTSCCVDSSESCDETSMIAQHIGIAKATLQHKEVQI